MVKAGEWGTAVYEHLSDGSAPYSVEGKRNKIVLWVDTTSDKSDVVV